MTAPVAVATCKTEGCDHAARASKGWCWGCYTKVRRYGSVEAAPRNHRGRPCSVPGCDRKNSSGVEVDGQVQPLCEMHYKRHKVHGSPTAGRWTEAAIPPGTEVVAPVEVGTFSRRNVEHGAPGRGSLADAYSIPDPRPVVALRHELAWRRRRDWSFEQAWQPALTEAMRECASANEASEWLDILGTEEHREHWRDAYNRAPAPPRIAALVVLAELGLADSDALDEYHGARAGRLG